MRGSRKESKKDVKGEAFRLVQESLRFREDGKGLEKLAREVVR